MNTNNSNPISDAILIPIDKNNPFNKQLPIETNELEPDPITDDFIKPFESNNLNPIYDTIQKPIDINKPTHFFDTIQKPIETNELNPISDTIQKPMVNNELEPNPITHEIVTSVHNDNAFSIQEAPTPGSKISKIKQIINPENLVEYDVFISYNWGIREVKLLIILHVVLII